MTQAKFHTNNQWTARHLSVDDRFWSKVEKLDSCWFWLAAQTPEGYGLFWLAGKYRGAHRVAYELSVGPIPEDHELDHLCRNPLCVNPDHLEPVLPRENQWRGHGTFAAIHGPKTHCIHGHPFDEENTYRRPTGGRACKTCQRQREAAYRGR